MSRIGRFAVFALITDKNEKVIRAEQHYLSKLTRNTMALNFPVHITLKGRFWAHEVTLVNFLSNLNKNLLCLKNEIELSQPKYIGSQLSWLEVLPNTLGFSTLLSLHKLFEREISQFSVLDEVPENHKNVHFRPHVTLGWDVNPELWHEYSTTRNLCSTQARFSHIALACYHQQWPLNELVTTILTIPMENDINSTGI